MLDPVVLLAARDPRRQRWARCALRSLLDVLSTAQAETAREVSDDPAFDAFVDELRALLGGDPPDDGGAATRSAAPPGAAVRQPRTEVAAGEGADREALARACIEAVHAILAANGLPHRLSSVSGDGSFWRVLHLLALTLPSPLEDVCHAALEETARSFGVLDVDPRRWRTFPGEARPKPLYPGLASPYNVPGLALSPAAPLDPRIGASDLPEDLQTLGRIVTVLAGFAAEPHQGLLQNAFRPVNPFGLKPADDVYADALIKRFQRVCTQGRSGSALEALRLRLDLDEAIHSLTTIPPPGSNSWWGRLQQRARQTLDGARDQAIASGHEVHWQVLSGPYADVYRLTRDETDIDVRVGRPGEVLLCLRVYARIDGTVLPGRVIYNPV